MRGPDALTRDSLALLLAQRDPGAQREFAAAYEVKVRHVGRVVSLRGIVEMGNVCAKNCFYCGIRRDKRPRALPADEPEISKLYNATSPCNTAPRAAVRRD